MKIPSLPQLSYLDICTNLAKQDPSKAIKMVTGFRPVDEEGRYLHWEDMQYRTPPAEFTLEEWWVGTKFARKAISKPLQFADKLGNQFSFCTPEPMLKDLWWLDKNTSGTLLSGGPAPNPENRNDYIINSLIEEAISSSQIEGATTTRKVATEMIRQRRAPGDKSERMIVNNFRAMNFIRGKKDEKLTPAVILELQKILTDGTLDDPAFEGKYRANNEIGVYDERDNTLLHNPPDFRELPKRMEILCRFANDENSSQFIHPLIRAIVLHFMFAYDHPFVDGNGRTARALFYWSAIKNGYWLMEFVSISSVIKKAKAKYRNAFLFVETDEGDVTYFIFHQLETIKKAVDEIYRYLEQKKEEMSDALAMLESNPRLREKINSRQLALLRHALKHPGYDYTIIKHQTSHDTVYQTARSDLLGLADDLKLLIKQKRGKAFVFISPADLAERIKENKPL